MAKTEATPRAQANAHPHARPEDLAAALDCAPMDDAPLSCAHSMSRGERLPDIDDDEGAHVPGEELTGGEVIDAHVHIFPTRLFEAIWKWFDAYAWKIRYRFDAEQVVEFLRARGVRRCIALHYAHKPGIARSLNAFARDVGLAHRDVVIPLGTVFPGEPDAAEIVREAFAMGLHGIKLHCHVQKMAADDPRLDEVYRLCEAANKTVVIHSGREPASPAYGVDTRALCGADQIDRVLERYPRLTMVVPHLGADEFAEYEALLAKHENLYLDTTCAVAGLFTSEVTPMGIVERHPDRVLYGTDFPNLPYAWDREIRRIVARPLDNAARAGIFSGNARRVFRF